jgi:hypothetical protein
MKSASPAKGKSFWLTQVQLTENLSNLRAATIGNLVNTVIAVCLFAGNVPPEALAGGLALMTFLLWTRSRIAKAFLASPDDEATIRRAARHVDWIAAALGAA